MNAAQRRKAFRKLCRDWPEGTIVTFRRYYLGATFEVVGTGVIGQNLMLEALQPRPGAMRRFAAASQLRKVPA